MNRHQQLVIEYLQEEVRVLREQLGKRPKFNDTQRRRLAVKVHRSKSSPALCQYRQPDTLLAWHRRLIAKKYDSRFKHQAQSRPTADPLSRGTKPSSIEEQVDRALEIAGGVSRYRRQRLGVILNYYREPA